MAIGNRNEYYDEKGLPLLAYGDNAREAEFRQAEMARIEDVRRARHYYAGTQFDEINEARAVALGMRSVEHLPSHERLHAYSTQIQDSVDYIASQMGSSFQLQVGPKPEKPPIPKAKTPFEKPERPERPEAPPNPTLDLLLAGLRRSPDLRGSDSAQDVSLVNNIREALIAMDTPCLILWDPIEQLAWPQFWDSEHVEFRFADRDRTVMEEARTTESVWTSEPVTGQPVRKLLHQRWALDGFGQCRITRWYDEDEPFAAPENTGLPFIPWANLRARKKSTKSLRGESAITSQIRATADRFNANEQIAYLISRYNSHGNLAVIGDATNLKAQLDQRINKDVADILTFPGGTALEVIQLPTDTAMIEHQKNTLLAAMYDGFGLTRTDSEALGELTVVTGYALEILNRKTDGTFNQIKSRYVGDFKQMLNMMLDVTAYKRTEEADLFDEDGLLSKVDVTAAPDEAGFQFDLLQMERLIAIDPLAVFPPDQRDFDVSLGTGYVVDTVLLQTEYEKKLISRRRYLKERGYTEDEIDEIEDELDFEKPPEPEMGLGAGAIGAAGAAILGAKGKDAVKPADPAKAKAAVRG